jgi:CRISPR-associated protein Csm5
MPEYALTVRPLSPVHVGGSDVLSADEYIVRSDGEFFFLHAWDPARFFPGLSPEQRSEFDRLIDAGGPTAVRQFLHRTVDPDRHARWSAGASPELHKLYRRELQSASAELEIHPMVRTGTRSRPYLPGSSIKGALRTAVIQHLLDGNRILANQASGAASGRPKYADRDVEAIVLGNRRPNGRPDLRADPFRAVRLSDCRLPDDATSIDPVDLVSLRPRRRAADPSGILLFYEMTFSAVDGEDIPAVGTLTVDTRLAEANAKRARGSESPHPVSRPGGEILTAERILDACNHFYLPRLEDEADRLRVARPTLSDACDRLLDLADDRSDRQALIRLGRFSHVECVTLAPPLRRASGGTTRGLAAGQAPMGWAMIELTPAGR